MTQLTQSAPDPHVITAHTVIDGTLYELAFPPTQLELAVSVCGWNTESFQGLNERDRREVAYLRSMEELEFPANLGKWLATYAVTGARS